MSDIVSWRLGIFVAVLLLMMAVEANYPKRQRVQSRTKRWQTNLSLAVINSVVLRIMGPVSAVLMADYVLDEGWGLLAFSPVALPFYLEIIVGVILLDFAIYLQHVASHRIPILWKFHKVHHVDRDIDVTTGIRFHPMEAIVSMVYKCLVVFLIGPITLSVIIFEIILNASAMFNHANVRIPKKIDGILRVLIVTPDSHRVHHSVKPNETNSNYGFFLSIWDRLCRTYKAQPKAGHDNMVIGLNEYQTVQTSLLGWCLKLPINKFFNKTSNEKAS